MLQRFLALFKKYYRGDKGMKLKETEKQIENSILEYLSLIKIGFFWKNNSTGIFDPTRKVFRKAKSKFLINGVADIIGVAGGSFICLEIKSEKGKQSESQKIFSERFTKNGGKYAVVRSISDVIITFKEWGML